MPERPNILFIVTDQQNARLMSCSGNEYLKTPAMGSIAARGVRFERAYCTCPSASVRKTWASRASRAMGARARPEQPAIA